MRIKQAKKELPYKEILKLKGMLDSANIKSEFHDDSKTAAKGYQIIVPYGDNMRLSVVQNKYSEGADVDLLEMWKLGSDENSTGRLTAAKCFALIKEKLNE